MAMDPLHAQIIRKVFLNTGWQARQSLKHMLDEGEVAILREALEVGPDDEINW